jgi:protein subunit release factor B
MNPYRGLEDRELLAQCDVEVRRGGGPGGQHRNKVETAVRLWHGPTGLVASAAERRSRQANLTLALERLREKLERLFHRPAPRVATRKGRGVKVRERERRERQAAKKRDRRRPPAEE